MCVREVTHMKSLWSFVLIVAVCAPVGTGCALEEERRPTGSTQGPGPEIDPETDVTNEDDVVTGGCEADEVRTCKVQINERNCFVGEQACEDGVWGDCGEPAEQD